MGHVFTTDFEKEYNWSVDPLKLFEAPILKMEANPKSKVVKHLKMVAKGCNIVILWLDCDREGENICFEVLDTIQDCIAQPKIILRAKFSSITSHDLNVAFHKNLVSPNRNEALSVDARQEIDLKVGVAFTRFQTNYFNMKYGNLDSNLISYGPCQIPTLGFCVDRHDFINQFKSKRFYRLKVNIDSSVVYNAKEVDKYSGEPTTSGFRTIIPLSNSKTYKDKPEVDKKIQTLSSHPFATCTNLKTSTSKRKRPVPLNTVTLLKICSKNLHIGPYQAMNVAEHLYISGYISYPRTESTSYPDTLNFIQLLKVQEAHYDWGSYVSDMLRNNKMKNPRKGVDHGDHPPIIPLKKSSHGELTGDALKVYDYVTRHFIATLSPDPVIETKLITLSMGEETFVYRHNVLKQEGFFGVMPWHWRYSTEDQDEDEISNNKSALNDIQVGESVLVTSINSVEDYTRPPSHLTESELIGLMEKHGIGTDASIPTHIQNIINRNYVKLDTRSRSLVPTQLGIVLVHGFHKIDPELVLPKVRSSIESFILNIAAGKKTFKEVVESSISLFKQKFIFFTDNVILMDQLFEASFTPVADMDVNTRLKTKCGKCKRYMKFIPMNPHRLYCNVCEEVYMLPPKDKIRSTGSELLCPLDGFELINVTNFKGKSCLVCPNCYANGNEISSKSIETGPTEQLTKNYTSNRSNASKITCYTCKNEACAYNYKKHIISDVCPSCDFGVLCLEQITSRRIDCNLCNYYFQLPADTTLSLRQDICERCSIKKFKLRSKSIPVDDDVKNNVCVVCHPEVSKHVTGTKNFNFKPRPKEDVIVRETYKPNQHQEKVQGKNQLNKRSNKRNDMNVSRKIEERQQGKQVKKGQHDHKKGSKGQLEHKKGQSEVKQGNKEPSNHKKGPHSQSIKQHSNQKVQNESRAFNTNQQSPNPRTQTEDSKQKPSLEKYEPKVPQPNPLKGGKPKGSKPQYVPKGPNRNQQVRYVKKETQTPDDNATNISKSLQHPPQSSKQPPQSSNPPTSNFKNYRPKYGGQKHVYVKKTSVPPTNPNETPKQFEPSSIQEISTSDSLSSKNERNSFHPRRGGPPRGK